MQSALIDVLLDVWSQVLVHDSKVVKLGSEQNQAQDRAPVKDSPPSWYPVPEFRLVRGLASRYEPQIISHRRTSTSVRRQMCFCLLVGPEPTKIRLGLFHRYSTRESLD